MEKELLGVFVSAHPLQQMTVDLSGVITCFCGDLNEGHAGKSVLLAGNITRVNPISTKKGDRMAFVTLEDLQGQCDVVVFPRTWEATKDLWQVDKIVLLRGKAEMRGEKISVVCEEVRDYIMRASAADDDSYAGALAHRETMFQSAASKGDAWAQAEHTAGNLAEPEGLAARDQALEEPDWLREAPPSWDEGVGPLAKSARETPGPEVSSPVPEPAPSPPRPSLLVQVTVQRTQDVERDKRLLTWVYDLLREHPGPDRFCVILRKNGGQLQLDFPNDTTRFSGELEQQLVRRLGAGNVEVRELS
jgi:hypothetical protein